MVKRRVTCHRKFPTNELFKFWLEELKEKAASYGLQTQFVYGKAVKSIQNCSLELLTAEETRTLENIGDKTAKLLGDKLREFVAEYGPPTFDNIQFVGVKVDDKDGDGSKASTTPKKRVKRKSNPRQYIPGYRTGGYAILRVLYDTYKDQPEDDNGIIPIPFMEKQELIAAAQRYCDEPMKHATKDKPYTAWNSVNTLIKHDLVRMNRANGSKMQYALTEEGIAMAKRLTDAAMGGGDGDASDDGHDSPPVAKQPKKTKATKKKNSSASPVRPSGSGASFDPDNDSASPTRWNFKNNAPSASAISKNLFTSSPPRSTVPAPKRSPSPILPQFNDDYDNDFNGNAPDYWNDHDLDPLPLARRISGPSATSYKGGEEKSVKLGYNYVDSDGLDTQFQDKAHVWIDETSLWYLVKTTDAYVKNVGIDRFCKIDGSNLPSEIEEKANWEDETVLMYLKSDFADDFAPGIELQKPDSAPTNGEAKASYQVEDDWLSAIHKNEKAAIEKPKTWTVPKGLFDFESGPSTSATSSRSFENNAPTSKWDYLAASPKKSTAKATTATERSDVVVFEPGQFEIFLIVDHAEIDGGVPMFGETTKNRKTLLLDVMKDLGLDYDKRKLPVGDYLFVAREKTAGAMNGAGKSVLIDRELVLGPIIERKRKDDLVASIKDGRYRDQKIRLRDCGVHKVIYLIEDVGGTKATFGMDEAALRSAMIGTLINDEFSLVQKKNMQEVAMYLKYMLEYLRDRFGDKRLISRRQDSPSVQELMDMGSDEIALQTFREFSELSAKRRPLTVGDAFARSLLQIPGVSQERAEAIRIVYPTLAHLLEAYEACDGEDEENKLLEAIPYGHLGRNLGSEVSKRIARFFCAVLPFTK